MYMQSHNADRETRKKTTTYKALLEFPGLEWGNTTHHER